VSVFPVGYRNTQYQSNVILGDFHLELLPTERELKKKLNRKRRRKRKLVSKASLAA
jgi:hypothetical protein